MRVELSESPTEIYLIVESDTILDLPAARAALPEDERQLVSGAPVAYLSDLDEEPEYRFTYGWAFPKESA